MNALCACPEAVAFVRGDEDDVPFRREPVLIDYGGSIVDGFPVLKVAIRDSHSFNRELVIHFRRLMNREANIRSPNNGNYCPCEKGTLVYALKRL